MYTHQILQIIKLPFFVFIGCFFVTTLKAEFLNFKIMISTKTPIISAYIVCKRNYIVELIMAENICYLLSPLEGFSINGSEAQSKLISYLPEILPFSYTSCVVIYHDYHKETR